MEKPLMSPAPGERRLRFVGDSLCITLRHPGGAFPHGCRPMLRTNLGKAAATHREIIASYAGKRPMSVAFWRDIPLGKNSDGSYAIELPLTEVGYFHAKAYMVDSNGFQVWPDGPDVGIPVHPDAYRTGNTIYCAFTRMFGGSRKLRATRDDALEKSLKKLDEQGYAVIPPSGTLRDLARQVPHITGKLGCRILHLLPVNPTPTTFARMGRFGSPYACEDLTGIDPALVEFDKRSTGGDQFRELATETHRHGARLFLDVVINHTGWGSTLQETHPEWFLRDAAGNFASPGAWGTIWEDLVELEPQHVELWEHFAAAFLTWCRRGVDGFRCDAGYKVPLPVWQYIIARVRLEFPNAVFLLEGLGGPWTATEQLLTEGGMQWAYSELFQNYSGADIQHYLDYVLRQNASIGLYVHYSETHDNDRLAKKGRAWSLLRNRLCALTSASGGYGFTCGVEWLADEKIDVHQSRGLAWGSRENILPELAGLNALLAMHPCFFDGARLTRLSADGSPVYALQRVSAENLDRVLVLINTDADSPQSFVLEESIFANLGSPGIDLLGGTLLEMAGPTDGKMTLRLAPAAAHCLGAIGRPVGLGGLEYRAARAQAAFAIQALGEVLRPEEIGACAWLDLAGKVSGDPLNFLAAVAALDREAARKDLFGALEAAAREFPRVIRWTLLDRRRIVPVPKDHWLCLEDSAPFRATLKTKGRFAEQHVESIQVKNGFVACFAPQKNEAVREAILELERYALTDEKVSGGILFLGPAPGAPPPADGRVLLTNGLGGMARLGVDLGNISSKYDCALAANLHSEFPVDRHVFVKRIRVWANAEGFITPVNLENLASFEPGPPARWRFVVHAADERTVEVELTADMLEHRNVTVFRFTEGNYRSPHEILRHKKINLRLTVRVDIEDRNFHSETRRNPGAEDHFNSHCHPLDEQTGFLFSPGNNRQLRVFAERGLYHPEAEWCENIPHPIEQSRGQTGSGDAFSPGWFELPLKKGESVALVLSAEPTDPGSDLIAQFESDREAHNKLVLNRARFEESDTFGRQLALAARAFLVRRGAGKTVIAGYPWFLDWGRDSLICARGYLAAGMVSDVAELLITFGRFVEKGTMPNTIHGENASNRDTSDAPLWYGVVCEETARRLNENLYEMLVDRRGRTIADVLLEIATGYARGTPNGICLDPESGLVWSPSHFTWMDTNSPAGTPREGYPIEIQVLWIRLLRQLEKLEIKSPVEKWAQIAARAER